MLFWIREIAGWALVVLGLYVFYIVFALLMQPAGYGVVVRDLVVIAVKGRVEAGDLGQSRKFGKQGSDRRQIVGLMQRCKCRQPLETRDHTVVDQYGAVVVGTAMDDPMANG